MMLIVHPDGHLKVKKRQAEMDNERGEAEGKRERMNPAESMICSVGLESGGSVPLSYISGVDFIGVERKEEFRLSFLQPNSVWVDLQQPHATLQEQPERISARPPNWSWMKSNLHCQSSERLPSPPTTHCYKHGMQRGRPFCFHDPGFNRLPGVGVYTKHYGVEQWTFAIIQPGVQLSVGWFFCVCQSVNVQRGECLCFLMCLFSSCAFINQRVCHLPSSDRTTATTHTSRMLIRQQRVHEVLPNSCNAIQNGAH